MVFLRKFSVLFMFALIGIGGCGYATAEAPPASDIHTTLKPRSGATASPRPSGARFGKKSARKIAQGVAAAQHALPKDPWDAASVWDTQTLQAQPQLAKRLREFLQGNYAQSLKSFKISGHTAEELHSLLIQKGFRVQEQKKNVSPQPSKKDEAFKHAPRSFSPHAPTSPILQKIYMHEDGGVVRLKLTGHRLHPEPHGIKCVLKDPQGGPSYANEAFKVTDEGRPVPKSPKKEDGLRLAGHDLDHPDTVFGWTDVIMEEGHINLKAESQNKK